jgi:hypothetical protein
MQPDFSSCDWLLRRSSITSSGARLRRSVASPRPRHAQKPQSQARATRRGSELGRRCQAHRKSPLKIAEQALLGVSGECGERQAVLNYTTPLRADTACSLGNSQFCAWARRFTRSSTMSSPPAQEFAPTAPPQTPGGCLQMLPGRRKMDQCAINVAIGCIRVACAREFRFAGIWPYTLHIHMGRGVGRGDFGDVRISCRITQHFFFFVCCLLERCGTVGAGACAGVGVRGGQASKL